MQKIDIKYLKADVNFLGNECPVAIMSYMQTHAANYTSYAGWVQIFMNEIILRVFAFRETKSYGFEWTEVERRSPALDRVARKNVYFTSMSGWKVVYKKKAVKSKTGYYGYGYEYFWESDFDVWGEEPKPMGIGIHIINYNKVFDLEKYKYCGYPGGFNLIEYLKLYEQYPEVEYFGKAGIWPTKGLILKAKKDKQFIRYLLAHRDEVNARGVRTVITAYEKKISFEEVEEYLYEKHQAEKKTYFAKGCKEVDRIKLYHWIMDNKISFWSYGDYFEAIKELGYDLTDTKNVYPKDFNRMHDLRINEYGSYKAKLKEEEMKALNDKFVMVAEQYKPFEIKGEKYSIILPSGIGDLVREGELLHHCVGKMGYDKKMADGKCVIAFIRLTSDIDTPFVTMEYLTDKHIVSQCYAEHDHRPDKEVIELADKWADIVTEGIRTAKRKLAAVV